MKHYNTFGNLIKETLVKKYIILLLSSFSLCGCNNDNKQLYNGYIDANLIYLGSNFSGRLREINVVKGQAIESGQLVFRLEQDSEQYSVDMSRSNSNNLKAQKRAILSQIQYAQKNYNRVQLLTEQNSASKDELDIAKQNLDVLNNQLSGLNAQIDANRYDTAQKAWQLQSKENFAPESGIVFDSYYNLGEFVTAGQPILALITNSNLKVTFFIPEAGLAKIKLNQKLRLSYDGSNQTFVAVVNYISNQAEFTPPVIFSREDRQKLVFKVEAKPQNVSLSQVHLGQPVTLEVMQ